MSARVISRGTWLCGKYGSGDADTSGQFPSGSGSSIPSHMRRVEPLRPAWASWRAIRAPVCRWTNSTMRRQASTCSGLYIPVQPGLIRPSRLTSVISATTRDAPPAARLPRWTRCQSFGVPSSAEYWHIGDTTTRFESTRSRSRNGVNMGGGGDATGTATPLCRAAPSANHRSTVATKRGSRTLRFSWVTRRLRVRRLIANWTGSRRWYRSVVSNHSRLTWAARWRLSTSGRRSAS